MWEAREPQSIIQAAEKAAAAGSFSSAEKLLREAARLQEASLGPRHPDLANTLNNLGIVCEMTRKYDDAEQYFRRAVSIARTSLPPEHPFVATSQNNLRDFCEARGKTVEPPAPAPASEPREDTAPDVKTPAPESKSAALEETPAEAHSPATVEAEPAALEVMPAPLETAPAALEAAASSAPEAAAAPEGEPAAPSAATGPALEDPVLTSQKFFYRMALGALGPIAMLMVVLAVGLPRLGAPELTAPSRNVGADAPVETAAITPTQPTAPARPIAPPQPAAPSKPVAETPAALEPARPIVIRAGLCGELDAWSCDPADRPVPPGPLFFYTQIKSPGATTIQHRWYQGNHLRQAVDLRIEANQSAGYRTFSRYLMQLDSGGNWRVEVRSQDGVLLDEERFEVR
jgi:tetratricopeptide repeat protein/DUF2914 family protein